MQVDPMKPTLIALGSKPSILQNDTLLSNFAFEFNLRRYRTVVERLSFITGGVGQGVRLTYLSKVGRCTSTQG